MRCYYEAEVISIFSVHIADESMTEKYCAFRRLSIISAKSVSPCQLYHIY